MPAPIMTLPVVAPLLQFSCGHCGTVLSVPATRAGVRGPCPSCQRAIVAPGSPPPAPAVPAAAPAPLVPRPRVVRPVPVPEPPPATEEKRSTLRRHTRIASEHSNRADHARRSDPAHGGADDPRTVMDGVTPHPRLWTSAAVGAVIGGGLVFGGLSAAQLRRDISPAPPPAAATTRTGFQENDDDAIAALAAHKKESARDLKSLLAAQQVVWQFFSAISAEEAGSLLSDAGTHALPENGLHSPLSGLTLRSKRRLPGEAGTASHWAVTTTRFGELVVEVSDASGQPRLNWAKLAPQLGVAPSPPEVRTAATP